MSKYCGKCGKENPEGNVFCYFCGSELYSGKLNNNQVNEKKQLLKVSKFLIGTGIALTIFNSIALLIIVIDAIDLQKSLIALFQIVNILNKTSLLIMIIGFILLLIIRKKTLKNSKILIGIGVAIGVFYYISLLSIQQLHNEKYISAHIFILLFWIFGFIGSSFLVIEITGFVSLLTEKSKSLIAPGALIGYGILIFFSLYSFSVASASVHLYPPVDLFEIKMIFSILMILSGYIWNLINLKNNSYK